MILESSSSTTGGNEEEISPYLLGAIWLTVLARANGSLPTPKLIALLSDELEKIRANSRYIPEESQLAFEPQRGFIERVYTTHRYTNSGKLPLRIDGNTSDS